MSSYAGRRLNLDRKTTPKCYVHRGNRTPVSDFPTAAVRSPGIVHLSTCHLLAGERAIIGFLPLPERRWNPHRES